MKNFIKSPGLWMVYFTLIILTGIACISPAAAETTAQPGAFAFVNVSVIPMDKERLLPDQTVLIAGGRILEMGPAELTAIPDDFSVIDASGKYLMPAFSDMHVHLLGDAWNMVFPPESRVPAVEIDMAAFMFPYLANGVTTVQVLSATEDHLALRESIVQGEILGPRLVLAQMIDGPDRAWPPPLSTWVASPIEARQAVLAAKAAGYDAMKVYSFLAPAEYDAIMSTAREVDIKVIGHIPLALSLDYVVEKGQDRIAHCEEVMKLANGDYSPRHINELADTVASNDTWIIPTLVTTRNILALFDDPGKELARPETRYYQHPMQQGVWSFIIQNLYEPIPEDQRQWIRDGFEQFQIPFTRALYKRGVKMLAGSDTLLPTLVPGFALHRELEELVATGLSPYEALKTSTTHPFEYLGEAEQAGTVEPGKQANLVLLRENPLTDIHNSRKVDGVVVRGQWLSGDQIQDRMESLEVSPETSTATANR